MFGGYHALLPMLIGRVFSLPTFIILGGTDCVSYPSIGYGTFRKVIQGWFTSGAYRLAKRLLPVHESLLYREETYYRMDSDYQGCRYWCKNLLTPSTTIYNGYDADRWVIEANQKRGLTFATIASAKNASTVILKGIDLVIVVAGYFPQCEFLIIGISEFLIPANAPKNVIFRPFETQKRILELLEETQFYLQLSISEGFPNALCEAMLSQCIPICSDVGAMPEIVGECGFIVYKREVDLLREAIESAIAVDNKKILGTNARKRIVEHFSMARREKEFKKLFEEF